MSDERNELAIPFPVEPESAEPDDGLYDFLYVDRARVSVLYAQLFPQGTLTTVKTSDQESSTKDSGIAGSIPQIFKAETKLLESASEGIERMFDATWVVPLEVLSQMKASNRIRESFTKAHHGSIMLLPGYLRLIDYAGLKDIWEPAINMMSNQSQEQQEQTRNAVAIVRGLPHTVHAHFLTRQGYLWSSLDSANLMIPAADMTLKYGGDPCGAWHMLFIFDAYPSPTVDPAQRDWHAGDAAFGVLQFMHGIRTQIGRPTTWYGVTPIMIYRPVAGRVEV